MHTRFTFAGATTLVLFYGGWLAAQAPTTGKTIYDSVYSAAQAQRGATLYTEKCANCHGAQLTGNDAPPLVGADFAGNWSGLTLDQMMTRIKTSMPADAPDSMTRAQVAEVMAHMIRATGAPAGQTDLPTGADALKAITYVGNPPAGASRPAAAPASPAAAATPSQNPMADGAKAQFTVVKDFVIRSAEKVPDSLYSFRPKPEVRTFAELYGHVADAFFGMCATAGGGTPPRSGIEQSVKTKADLLQALKDGATYCDGVMTAMTDQRGIEPVAFYFGPTPRLSVLYFATAHAYEHYGNLVTYMRLNGIVPPSSETPPR